MIDINNFDAIEIGLASSKQIRSWSSGEVTKPETINYRTLKPEKDGLFCERIFGPTKDWECYCGKYKRVRYKGIVCERCGVEVTRSKVRRERMGHIDLAAPVSHIWFFKGVPSRIGYLLDMAPKELEKVLYFAASMVTWVDDEAREADLDTLRGNVDEALDAYAAEKEERLLELRESLERRDGVPQHGRPGRASPTRTTCGPSTSTSTPKKLVRRRPREAAQGHQEGHGVRHRGHRGLHRGRRRAAAPGLGAVPDDGARSRSSTTRRCSASSRSASAPRTAGASTSAAAWAPRRSATCSSRSTWTPSATILEDQIKTAKGQKQQRAVKRLKVVSAFLKTDREGRRINSPDMMILEAVPVIPPELRPMVQLDGGRFATSDLNDLYRRVINRNNRLKRLLDLGAPEIIVNNEKRMLQEAVDALFDNGRRGRPVTGPGNRALKSLSDMLKGKQGRFRQNLLGKRVDYSGRSVIVAGPSLRLHQCGLPKLMALELFKPFIMARLVERKAVQNIKAAKKMVDSMIPEVWDVLEEVIHEHPVLLNRAPTLHRLGIQAFEPVLVEGKAIQVHPLVCHAYNADFDGDQMAVHLPLSAEAQAEARVLMLSSNNILSPAHGAPLATPTQDMILGTYYLTYGEDAETLAKIDPAKHEPRVQAFRLAQEAELAYEGKLVELHDVAHYRPEWLEGGHIATTVGRIIFNDKIERALEETLGDEFDRSRYSFINTTLKKRDVTAFLDQLVQEFGAPAISQVLDAFKDLGFKYATQAGITVSKNDVVVPPDKDEIIAGFEKRVGADPGAVRRGPDHAGGAPPGGHRPVERGDRRGRRGDDRATSRRPTALNSIYMMANSGARGSVKQIRQLAGMRGLMANPKGEIIERPVKASFIEGLDVLEYFTSTHGARKGLADTALRTADSGYLTRRLVDVAQDVIIRARGLRHRGVPRAAAAQEGRRAERDARRALRGRRRQGRAQQERRSSRRATRSAAPTSSTLIEAFGDDDGRQDPGALRAQVRGAVGPVPGVLRPLAGLRRDRHDRRRGRHHRRAVDRRAGHAADHADVPHRRRRRRGHHARPAAHRRAVRGAQAEGPGEDRRGRRRRVRRGHRQVAHRRHHRRRRRGAPPHVPAPDAPARERGRARSSRARSSTRARCTRTSCWRSAAGPRPSCTSSRRSRRSTSPRAWTSTTSTSKLIVRQMLKKVRVDQKGDTNYLPGQFVDRHELRRVNGEIEAAGGETAAFEEIILGITKASLATDSFLSAASFQETTKVLTDAALEGKIDRLAGLKENVIIGKLIPAATGSSATGRSRSSRPSRSPAASTTSRCSRATSSPPSWGSTTARASAASARRSTPRSSRRSAPGSAAARPAAASTTSAGTSTSPTTSK